MPQTRLKSEFLRYLAFSREDDAARDQLPSLNDLSTELGVSVARLREQLEVARALGLVEVRPRTGIRRLPFDFMPTVRLSLSYALEIDRSYFDSFSELRNHVEASFWFEAVDKLDSQDLEDLKDLMASAWEKLHSPQIKIPHAEHRELHLCIFRRLNNPFVLGILEAYWEAYEAVGLNVYADYDYLQRVWGYHQQMVDAIYMGDAQVGYRALMEHKDLLYHRPVASLMGNGVLAK